MHALIAEIMLLQRVKIWLRRTAGVNNFTTVSSATFAMQGVELLGTAVMSVKIVWCVS